MTRDLGMALGVKSLGLRDRHLNNECADRCAAQSAPLQFYWIAEFSPSLFPRVPEETRRACC